MAEVADTLLSIHYIT